jgi:hypothetical protein
VLTIDSSSPAVRRAWALKATDARARRTQLFRSLHLSAVELEVADDAVAALVNLMKQRAAGRRR